MKRPPFASDEAGATAVEFAFVISVAVLVLFGLLQVGLMTYTYSMLNRAVQEAARCAAVRSVTNCTDAYMDNAPIVLGWARNSYAGAANATFTYDNSATCSQEPGSATNNGRSVTGTAPYKFSVPGIGKTITLSATSCYPYYNGT